MRSVVVPQCKANSRRLSWVTITLLSRKLAQRGKLRRRRAQPEEGAACQGVSPLLSPKLVSGSDKRGLTVKTGSALGTFVPTADGACLGSQTRF